MDSIERAIEHIRAGGMIVVVDDEDRENEGDLIMAAEKVTPEAITFMARQACGLICLALTGEQVDRLGLPMMVPTLENTENFGTAFTISIEAATGVTTGISAADRARTILVAADPASTPDSVTLPGHIFPLRARAGGVLERPGHTEAAVDLARLAGLTPAGVVCEIMDEDGTMMRLPQLKEFARRHDLPIITIAALIDYLQGLATSSSAEEPGNGELNQARPLQLQSVAASRLPTEWGEFRLHLFLDPVDGREHLALVMGEFDGRTPVLVRAHSECLTGDVLGSRRCDCGSQLHRALEQIAREGRGVLLYLRQEGRGIGLANKLRAYALQDQGLDTVEANEQLGLPIDARDYGVGAQMLRALGVGRVRLITNNPDKLAQLARHGLEVVERVPIQVPANPANQRYLATKREKLGHLLEEQFDIRLRLHA